MSRSIHTTRRSIREAREEGWRDETAREERVRALTEELRTKRAIKRQTLRGPATGDDALPPIVVTDESAVVRFPASADDLRALVRRLPRGAAEGIAEIRLELGQDAQVEYLREGGHPLEERDPHVGRPGCECLPGVFSGDILGEYVPDAGRIHVYAYVYAADLPERAIIEPYLRLRMLSTFVHEIAHHFDECWRVDRGRWRTDDHDRMERYAESVQYDWVREHVVPWLWETYPHEYERLSLFLKEHGGVDLPLDVLAGDPRITVGNGRFRYVDQASEALRAILDGLRSGSAPHDIRVDVAEQLRWAGQYLHSLIAAESVLAEDPGHVGARLAKAQVLDDMERSSEALAVVDEVLREHPDHARALEVKCYVARSAWRWAEVAAAVEALERVAPDALRAPTQLARARAYLELERWDELERLLGSLELGRWHVVHALGLRAVALLRRGRLDEALELAERGIREHPRIFGWHIFAAVRIDILAQRGVPFDASGIQLGHLDSMRRSGYGGWVDRVEAVVARARRG